MSFAIFKKSKSCAASFAVILATVGMGCTQSVPSQFKAAPADTARTETTTKKEDR